MSKVHFELPSSIAELKNFLPYPHSKAWDNFSQFSLVELIFVKESTREVWMAIFNLSQKCNNDIKHDDLKTEIENDPILKNHFFHEFPIELNGDNGTTSDSQRAQGSTVMRNLVVHFGINSVLDSEKKEKLIKELVKMLQNGVISSGVKNRLLNRGLIRMTGISKEYKLERKIHEVDTYGEWNFDQFQDLIEVWVERKDASSFPSLWFVSEETVVTHAGTEDVPVESSTESLFNHMIKQVVIDTQEISLIDWITFLLNEEGKSIERANQWSLLLKNHSVDSLADLRKWSNNDWEKCNWLPINARILMKRSIDSMKGDQSKNSKSSLSLAEFLGKLHIIKRYFYYQAGRISELSLLDSEAIKVAFNEVKEKYHGNQLLEDIDRRFFKIFEFSNFENVKIPKGLLLFGPPGTGKVCMSTVMYHAFSFTN